MDELLDVLIESGGKTAYVLPLGSFAPACALGAHKPLGPRSGAHWRSEPKAVNRYGVTSHELAVQAQRLTPSATFVPLS